MLCISVSRHNLTDTQRNALWGKYKYLVNYLYNLRFLVGLLGGRGPHISGGDCLAVQAS